MVDEAVGGAGAGAQLQRDGEPARHRQSHPLRRAARRLCAARQRDDARRRRRRAARPPRRCARWRRSSISTTPAFRSRAACCRRAPARRGTTPSSGATRAAPTGSASTSCRTARSPASCATPAAPWSGVETTRGDDPREEGRARGRRLDLAARREARSAPADRELRAAGLRLGGDQAAGPRRHHLRRRPLLHLAVRQGRPRLRRRPRRLQFLRPARQPARPSRTCSKAAWR